MKFIDILEKKEYSGLVKLGAMVLGFLLILTMAYAADPAPAADAKGPKDQAKTFIDNRGKIYAKQLDSARQRRLLFEEAVSEAKKDEANLNGRMEELKAIYDEMKHDGLLIVDSKDATK